MTPQYQFNLGSDPLLFQRYNNGDFTNNIEQEIAKLTALKQQLNVVANNQPEQLNLWNEIDKEVASLNADQQKLLASDETYSAINNELQILIQQELINSVKTKVASSSTGRQLLEKQLNNLRDKKQSIIDKSNADIELFKKFKIAVQANPNLTYAEFVKSINN